MLKCLNMFLAAILALDQCMCVQNLETDLRMKDSNVTRPVIDTLSPCSVNVTYYTVLVDCSGRSLTTLLSSWFPENTTDLMLQNNKLTSIHNDTFQNLLQLERLSLQNNVLSYIEPRAFQHLGNLQYLNLENNDLDFFQIPVDTFSHLVNLRELRLNQMSVDFFKEKNKLHIKLQITIFPDGMFGYLTNLTILSVSAHGRVLYFNNEFRNLTKLTELHVSGSVDIIEANSFENVASVKTLYLTNFPLVTNFSDVALGFFKELNFITYHRVHMGLHVALNTLRPLVYTNITYLRISYTHLIPHKTYLSITKLDGVLDSLSTRYLQEICVQELNMDGNNIFVVFDDTFFSLTLNRCLKKVSLKDNPLIGTIAAVYKLTRMGALKSIQISSSFSYNNEIDEMFSSLITNKIGKKLKPLTRTETAEDDFSNLVTSFVDNESITGENGINSMIPLPHRAAMTTETNLHSLPNELEIYISESLEHLDMSSLFQRLFLNVKYKVHGGQNLIYLDLTNNEIELFEVPFVGFPNLKTLKISYNYAPSFTTSLFDFLPSLETLCVDHCQISSSFMSQNSYRIFKNLSNLTFLDLSFNSLDILSPKTFSDNHKLEVLIISGNRFNDIPFDLKLTPNLNYLDLRKNAIQSISKSNQNIMDRQSEVLGTFHLLLEGNTLSCGCSNLGFLQWLLETNVILDGNRNFTCISNDGLLSFSLAYKDIGGFWRKCWAQTFLNSSIVIFSLIVVGYLLVFVWTKNKTFIMSRLFQIFTGFEKHKESDYMFGVFIGYCDSDYTFACFPLRQYIENELDLKTFIRDRDLSPSTPFAQGIMEAINSSWRVVLVINESFLNQNEWLMFTIRSAIYSISPANPYRVVILVEQRYVHSVPRELWSSVPEDNVLVVNKWQMNYDLKQKLKTRLLAV